MPLIAVDPNWIGQGLGTLLMKRALQRCDEQASAAYLESSNPKNIPFYQRHGFKVIGEIQHGGSPPLTPMLRTAPAPPTKLNVPAHSFPDALGDNAHGGTAGHDKWSHRERTSRTRCSSQVGGRL